MRHPETVRRLNKALTACDKVVPDSNGRRDRLTAGDHLGVGERSTRNTVAHATDALTALGLELVIRERQEAHGTIEYLL